MPSRASPGVIRPGVLGPISRVRLFFKILRTSSMSRTGTLSEMQTARSNPASAASAIADFTIRAGTNINEAVAPVSAAASFTVSKTGRPR